MSLLDDIRALWGTTPSPKWPDRLITEPNAFGLMIEALGPAIRLWDGCALTPYAILFPRRTRRQHGLLTWPPSGTHLPRHPDEKTRVDARGPKVVILVGPVPLRCVAAHCGVGTQAATHLTIGGLGTGEMIQVRQPSRPHLPRPSAAHAHDDLPPVRTLLWQGGPSAVQTHQRQVRVLPRLLLRAPSRLQSPEVPNHRALSDQTQP